jgi:hypothetical protein
VEEIKGFPIRLCSFYSIPLAYLFSRLSGVLYIPQFLPLIHPPLSTLEAEKQFVTFFYDYDDATDDEPDPGQSRASIHNV